MVFCLFVGLQHVGCYLLTQDHLNYLELINTSDLAEDIPGRSKGNGYTISRDNTLKECGKTAQRRNYVNFGLRGSLCVIGSLTFTDGGPSRMCTNGTPQAYSEGGMAIDVFKIVDKEDFELSVRSYKRCGSDFCHLSEKDVFSAGTHTHHHLLTILLHLLFVLHWSLWLSL